MSEAVSDITGYTLCESKNNCYLYTYFRFNKFVIFFIYYIFSAILCNKKINT